MRIHYARLSIPLFTLVMIPTLIPCCRGYRIVLQALFPFMSMLRYLIGINFDLGFLPIYGNNGLIRKPMQGEKFGLLLFFLVTTLAGRFSVVLDVWSK